MFRFTPPCMPTVIPRAVLHLCLTPFQRSVYFYNLPASRRALTLLATMGRHVSLEPPAALYLCPVVLPKDHQISTFSASDGRDELDTPESLAVEASGPPRGLGPTHGCSTLRALRSMSGTVVRPVPGYSCKLSSSSLISPRCWAWFLVRRKLG